MLGFLIDWPGQTIFALCPIFYHDLFFFFVAFLSFRANAGSLRLLIFPFTGRFGSMVGGESASPRELLPLFLDFSAEKVE